eukprot:m.164037 g.164037  ORF g.164037 m.164037 type:complete len:767 (-) comp31319_c1_seq1:340-2640(-)
MAAKKAQAKMTTGNADPSRMLTMMRPGELMSFDEDQRIAIFEMVKQGSITIEEAHAEVKRTSPKQYQLKYCGSQPGLAPTLKSSLSQTQGDLAINEAIALLKKSKAIPTKAMLHCSTIGLKIVDKEDTEDDLDHEIENEPIEQIAYANIVNSDKKRFAYVTSYSRLGLLWTHVFQCSKSKEAAEIVHVINERRKMAAEQKKVVKGTRLDTMSANIAEEDEDEGGAIAAYFCRYLGNVNVPEIQGDEVVREAVTKMKDVIKEAGTMNERVARRMSSAKTKRLSSRGHSTSSEDGDDVESLAVNVPVLLVVSSEGLRTVDEMTRDVMHNVIIKAISYSTEIVGRKIELFAFIEVDDRRNTNTCHIYLCERGIKGMALSVCNDVCIAFDIALQEAKARAGNPLLPMGKIKDTVTGPLAKVDLPRKDMVAVKAIGAGQFGKVFLATLVSEPTEKRAVKMLRSGASVADRQEFLREAETMVAIGENPNVVTFIGAAVAQRPWLVVLEYCQYGDLSDVLKAMARRKISLTLREQMSIAEQLATGMEFIAGKRFVHMDLAARNVLVAERSCMKIADFGLTHGFDAGKEHYKQLGVLKLSIRWLAIDSFDNKLFSEKSDVWSYAITMWEVFSYGVQPYKGFKLQEVLKMVRGGTRLVKPEACPQDLFEMFQTCWLLDRNQRPTFNALSKFAAELTAKLPSSIPRIRDIGVLLNADLTKKIQRMSIRVKKNATNPGGDASGVDTEGLTGAMDMIGSTATLKGTTRMDTELAELDE